jgi:hypothetical protein
LSGASLTVPNVTIVPVTDDAPQLWATWVAWGGEGIVLKIAAPSTGLVSARLTG